MCVILKVLTEEDRMSLCVEAGVFKYLSISFENMMTDSYLYSVEDLRNSDSNISLRYTYSLCFNKFKGSGKMKTSTITDVMNMNPNGNISCGSSMKYANSDIPSEIHSCLKIFKDFTLPRL